MSYLFHAPGNVRDLRDLPQLENKFTDLWNNASNAEDNRGKYMGRYINIASGISKNYVDPREVEPSGTPVASPWNGFPRAISRWYNDELSPENKNKAEAVADVLTPVLYWVMPGDDGSLQVFQALKHQLPFYQARYGDFIAQLAQPFRKVEDDNSLGEQVLHFRRQQDEYVEWHADYDAENKLKKLTFSAEPPDYWRALAEVSPERVLDLYQKYIDPSIQINDLFYDKDLAVFGVDSQGQAQWFIYGGKGEYNELNEWNTVKGIMHLTHAANTLGAEVRLAADASIFYASDNNNSRTGTAKELVRIACGGYGGINRSSDPSIGVNVAAIIKSGKRFTLTDPVGLYIAKVNIGGLTGPLGQPIGMNAYEFIRGTDDPFEPRILRFEVRLPDNFDFGLDECILDGRKLSRGGQVARQTTVQLYVNLYEGGVDVTESRCVGRPCEHPERTGVYTHGSVNGNCPTADSLSWLFQTPYEGEATQEGEQEALRAIANASRATPKTMERAVRREITLRPIKVMTKAHEQD